MERFLGFVWRGQPARAPDISSPSGAAQRFGSTFPYGTLIVNLLGCFAIAAVMHAAMALSWSPTVRAAITIGFIGGLTTYSSFDYETTRLLEEGALGSAAVNATATVIGALPRAGLECSAPGSCLAGEEDVMRVLDGNQFLVRILVGESDRFHHTPLSCALLERLRREGFAGATVIHGVAGLGRAV